MGVRPVVGKAFYGALFVVVIPVGLILWAIATRDAVPLPVVSQTWAGIVLVAVAAALIPAGMWALWRRGKGLPMNAYPPPVYVASGVFRYLAHPIYVGFGALSIGAAYSPISELALRAGYNYGKNPVPNKYLNALFPAIVENHVTFGAGYAFNERFSADASLVYALESDARNPGNGSDIPPVESVHGQLNWQILFSTRF